MGASAFFREGRKGDGRWRGEAAAFRAMVSSGPQSVHPPTQPRPQGSPGSATSLPQPKTLSPAQKPQNLPLSSLHPCQPMLLPAVPPFAQPSSHLSTLLWGHFFPGCPPGFHI